MNIDILRLIAFGFIVMIHTLIYQHNFMQYNTIFSIVGTGVNLFIIMSGYLILDKETKNPWKFFKKRFTIILIPFIFWNIVYMIVYKATVFQMLAIIAGYRFAFSHFWYVYMLVGLYLLTPWLQKVLKYAEKETFFIVVLWFGVNVLKTFLVRYKLPFLNLSNFPITGLLGYYLLGYYIKKYYKIIKYKYVVSGILSGFVITFLVSYHSFYFLDKRDPTSYDKNTLGIFILSISIAILIIKLLEKYKRKNEIATLSKATYNAYFVHILVMYGIANFTQNFYIVTVLCIPISLAIGIAFDILFQKLIFKRIL